MQISDALEQTTQPGKIYQKLQRNEIKEAQTILHKKLKGDPNYQDVFYDCKTCNKRITTYYNMRNHLRRYHSNASEIHCTFLEQNNYSL